MTTAIPLPAGADGELRLETDSAVAVLTLNRPDRLNALSHDLVDALSAQLRALATEPTVRAVVVTGAGKAFSSGADLRGGPSDAEAVIRNHYVPLVEEIVTCPVPVVAAINGVAAGAAVSIAAACDLRIASENARFQLSFTRVGLVPDAGATWLLPRLIGHGRASEMALLAEPVDAQTALDWGLVNKVVAADSVVAHAVAVATTLASRSSSVGPTKELLRTGWERVLDEQLVLEAQWQGRLQHEPDFAEARTAFVEKRPPSFKDRTPRR
ncbi:2-(1,2-epoxy-1,2-dihydrophenyl)acetyl-CoA isomerase PaaG [Rhodococcus olei]|uniref:2-(1,2-epoxy-1,2-dihydrophenyl)acetyl-CoA isomerase PaaG n=1 Tax=Rhodococcus olei TaxID=2161675 RepID=A0ABP8PQ54_9NOCA